MLHKQTGAEPYGAGYTEPEKSTNAHLSAAATKLVSRCVQAREKEAASPRGRPGSQPKPKKKKHRFLFPGRGGLKRSR